MVSAFEVKALIARGTIYVKTKVMRVFLTYPFNT